MNDILHFAVRTHNIEIVDLILKYNSTPSFINQLNTSHETALCCACIINDIKIVKRLLSIPGINLSICNPFMNFKFNGMQESFNIGLDIIDAIIIFCGDNIQSETQAIHHILNEFAKEIDYNVNKDKLIWEKSLRFLRIKSIDPNYYYDHKTFLHRACSHNEIKVVEDLLKINSIDVNKYTTDQHQTPLMIALFSSKIEIAKLLIQYHKTNINAKDCYNRSVLELAIENNLKEIIELLLKNERFDPIESELDYNFCIVTTEISKILISSSSLNINHAFDLDFMEKYKYNRSFNRSDNLLCFDIIKKTALTHSVENNNIDKIDLIINHPSFDKDESDINSAIFISVKNKNIDIFKKLMPLINNDVNVHCQLNDESLIEVASKYLFDEIVDYILNDNNFDFNSDQIVNAFIQVFSLNKKYKRNSVNFLEMINKIYNYDKAHSHLIDLTKLLPNGKSLFTSISKNFSEISNLVEFLIKHDADPNMPDKYHIYPFEYAIQINSLPFIKSLINSNKINSSQLVKGKTYLHIAAVYAKYKETFDFLLKTNLFDINSVNDIGETPLMIACQVRNLHAINLLFENDNLDYLHCDEDGNDALNILNPSFKDVKQSKEAYHNKIVSIINNQNDKL